MRDRLPEYAKALGAKKPIRIPVFLARIAAGPYAVYMMTAMEDASNVWVRKELG